ncbi:MAG: indole-3-glycerol phosphate synthase TrpC, partial [Treponema sp.]|nr:indole-3-glycerol phosphate synthase TrpC [Treponema sp.]
ELWVKSDNPAQTPYPANQDNNKGYYNIGIPQNTLCNSVVKNILPFESALSASGLSFICEVKKASPSKGIISEDFPWLEIAKEYEIGGAAAISVLTEPEFFLGSGLYLQEISKAVKIPTLRKDFIIDPYQIYEAKLWGAQAILLICALLEPETISSFIAIADELELDCLVEVHNEDETREAIEAGSRIIGINNRDLTNFKVDTGLTARLMKNIPAGILTVAESGINKTDDIRELIGIGVDAVLIGESLMRSADKKKFLSELRAVPAQQ